MTPMSTNSRSLNRSTLAMEPRALYGALCQAAHVGHAKSDLASGYRIWSFLLESPRWGHARVARSLSSTRSDARLDSAAQLHFGRDEIEQGGEDIRPWSRAPAICG